MYGFYVTEQGVDKIASAVSAGEKVALTHYAVGDGGDKTGERDLAISALNNELYRKQFDTSDSFDKKDNKLLIKVVLPNDTPELTFNEVGYFDSEGTLIVYGVMGDVVKKQGDETSPQTLEHDNYIEFTQNEIESITVITGNEIVDSVIERLTVVERELPNKVDNSKYEELKELVDTKAGSEELNQLKTTINNEWTPKFDEFETNLANKVDKVEGMTLTSNNFTDEYKNQIDTNKTDLTSLIARVTTLENQLSGLAVIMEELI